MKRRIAHHSPTPPRARPQVLLTMVVILGLAAAAVWYLAVPRGEHWTITAKRAVEEADFATAEKILLREHRRAPDDLAILQVLAEVNQIQGRHAEALEWLSRIPDSAGEAAFRARLDGATHAMHLHDYRLTRTLLDQSLALNPVFAPALRARCNLELNLMRPQEARREIVALDKSGQATALDICLFCVGDRLHYDPRENIETLESFLRKEPGNPLIIAALAHNYVRVNRREDAVRILQPADAASDHPDAWRVSLGIIENEIGLGRYAEAATSLEKLPSEADTLPRTWLAKARTWRELGHSAAASKAFANARLLDPFDPEPVYALSRIEQLAGHKAVADRLLDQTKELQRLNQILDDVLGDQTEDEPDLLLQIAERLYALDARRECLVCARSLQENIRTRAAAAQLETRLRQDGKPIPPHLSVAGFAELTPVQLTESDKPAGH